MNGHCNHLALKFSVCVKERQDRLHNNLRVMLSPLKSPVLRKYSNPFKRPGMYPSISKCNAKRCNCCMHLCTNSIVTSSVNGRKFSVVNNSDLD